MDTAQNINLPTPYFEANVALTSELVLFAVVGLLAALDERRDDLWEVRGEFIAKDTCHHAEEEEAALLQARAPELDAVEGLAHHVRKVGTEGLLTDGLRERPDSIHGDAAQLLLLAGSGKHKEVLEAIHRRLEVGKELLLRRVGRTADRADDNRLDFNGCRVEQADHALHDEVQILVDHVVHDLQKRIERCARSALGDGVIDELHDGRNKERVLRRTVVLQPFAKTADSNTAGLADGGVTVLQGSLDDRPHLWHQRGHVLAASLDRNAESEDRTTALRRVRRREVLLD